MTEAAKEEAPIEATLTQPEPLSSGSPWLVALAEFAAATAEAAALLATLATDEAAPQFGDQLHPQLVAPPPQVHLSPLLAKVS